MSIAGATQTNFNREKMKPGVYLARVDNVRVGPDRNGNGLHIDYTVQKVLETFNRESGEEWPTSRVGSSFHWACYPENVTPKGGFSRQDLENRERGKIVKALAGAMGYGGNELDFFDDDVLDSCVVYFEKDRPTSEVCALAGRLFEVTAAPHVNAKGEHTVILSFGPSDEQEPLPRGPVAAGAHGQAVSSEPAPSDDEAPPPDEEDAPPPEPEKSFEDLALEAGWVSRAPKHPGWYYNAATKEQLRENALKAKLGA